MQPKLSFDSLVTIRLIEQQHLELEQLVRSQILKRQGLIFCSVSPFVSLQDG